MGDHNGPVFQVTQVADSPLVLSVPHCGTELSPDVRDVLSADGLGLIDTDWHMDQVALGAAKGRANVLAARYSRYMIDVNRDREDAPLYAGATTGLISTIDFDGRALYQPGHEPDQAEVEARALTYWDPYHNELTRLIAAAKRTHGFCVVLECHSIRSRVERLFDGVLPDINIGSFDGKSASPDLIARIMAVCEGGPFSHVLNGRFKGGYITRQYGQPDQNVHVVQIEIAQKNYMFERPPWELNPEKAPVLTSFVGDVVGAMADFADTLTARSGGGA